ncbi:ribosomal-processing cysteine protease Prp [Mahella sp.]|uniref:ribosomal-processing cysteine protease Prp n=1 Tax=Mahella sp. TaxID=2798721 RepID=UPI0025C1B9B3|nr:ribosomal-processing cysteine protease Prp [Mahella sp.]MBZ4664921.1 hypothetical protein [Mahella sp.]
MISVKFYKAEDGSIKGFSIDGHADYGDEGSDIVCAAVSMVAQTTALSMQELLNIPIRLEMDKGNMICLLPDEYERSRDDAQLLLRAMELGLKNIEQGYKGNIRVIEEGV